MTKHSSIYMLWVFIASIATGSALSAPSPPVKAPPVTASVYEETLPMLYASRLVYNFADIVARARADKIDLKLPEDFPLKDLSRFQEESIDLREFNGGNGISFAQLNDVLNLNAEVIAAKFNDKDSEYTKSVVTDIRDYFANSEGDEGSEKNYFLSTYRSLQNKIACVYGVVKDTQNKRIIVSFRGSQNPFTNRDWKTNFNAKLVELKTPKKVRDKMEGVLQKRVLVHRGFYEYLFDNKKLDGMQKYDEIISDIEPLMEDGYSLYVTGHSLGGALATMFSFKLAGAGKKRDWVPKPVSCITFCAPFSGTSGYRTAFEQMELDGLIRSLRVNNGEDIVPAIPTNSIGIGRRRSMKHTGINLRLTKKGMRLLHSSNSGLTNAIRNSFLKPIWKGLTWHGLPLVEDRLNNNADKLTAVTLDDLYKDDSIVSSSFKEGQVNHDKDEKDL